MTLLAAMLAAVAAGIHLLTAPMPAVSGQSLPPSVAFPALPASSLPATVAAASAAQAPKAGVGEALPQVFTTAVEEAASRPTRSLADPDAPRATSNYPRHSAPTAGR
ncbi:hypothetical protein [Roseateles violae]|uniref:Uncharacterized protein n=1 Tax=Roseateles violae TaxID=3058042 RepID=A0ABT8DPQ2_9BURK|nr:hypothetical protein [Pelomonas sp. PFR6]MDN3920320.1 hypothetical protein [Pelomonas sp. PFR6]